MRRWLTAGRGAGLLVVVIVVVGCSIGPKKTPLVEAVRENDTAKVRSLLEGGADPDEPDALSRPLIVASWDDNWTTTLHVLLRYGADPDLRDEGKLGRTPLTTAVHFDARANVAALIAGGADLRIADGSGNTPCDEARAEDTDPAIVELVC